MISAPVFFFVIFAVKGLGSVRADVPWLSPITVHLLGNETFNIAIILENIPQEANRYLLNFQTGNCEKKNIENYNQGEPPCRVINKSGTIPEDRKIIYSKELNEETHAKVYIDIKDENKFCSTKMVIDGARLNSSVDDDAFRKACLDHGVTPCPITVDFRNKCDDVTPYRINCRQFDKRLTCKSPEEMIPSGTEHHWNQRDSEGHDIGNIPTVYGDKTIFEMTLLPFDANAYINSVMISTSFNKDLPTEKYKILLPSNEYEKYNVEHEIKYSDSERPKTFSCQKRSHTQMGWINSKGDRIETINSPTKTVTFRKEHNNNILCCIHYIINGTNIVRDVNNFTVLRYEKPVYSVKSTTGPTVKPMSKSTTTPKPHNRYSVTVLPQNTTRKQNPMNRQQTEPPGDVSKPQKTFGDDRYKEHETDKSKYYIGVSAVVATIILISLIAVSLKKYCRKSSDPEQILQLETYACPNMVTYAELDIRPGTAPPPAMPETTYAEIVGVLKPVQKNG